MASLVAGYEYDIFISYRQKDNKYDGWVTEFVSNLKKELEATFKENISIYFDSNPYDGLLETHNVDKSLEGKLKCLIFIPIISQTYCDIKSFAWQHEFCTFNKLAKEDQLGRDIKLNNGNVGSRILPIKIHDLDSEDKALLESELGGVLRAIEFIYKESGVNRPLKATDSKNDNQNKTDYRNQVNKVANAIKEIIIALKNPVAALRRTTISEQPTPRETKSKKSIITIAIAILLIGAAGYLLYIKFFQPIERDIVIDKSIAVLPFSDISELHDQGWFSDGMMIEILDHLFKIEDLRVIPRNSTLGYKDSTKPLKEIASELGVANLIQGSVRRAGNKFKISVALVDGSSEKRLWQHTYEDDIDEKGRIFAVQSDVATQIANYLKAQITPEVQERLNTIPTQNQEAYDLFLKGRERIELFYSSSNLSDIYKGIDYFNQATSLDPNYANAYAGLARAHWELGQFLPDHGTGRSQSSIP